MEASTGVRRLGLIFASFALTFSGLTVRPASAAAFSQESQLALLPGTVELDPLLADAIVAAINESSAMLAGSVFFAPTDLRTAEGWALVSIVGFTALGEDQTWHAEDGSWFGRALAHQAGPGNWAAGMDGTERFAAMLSEAPPSVVSSAVGPTEAEQFASRSAASARIFPWPAEDAMIYGPLGIHDGGGGRKAVDFASDGNVAAGHASGTVVASQAGTIDFVCRDGTSVTILVGSMLYAHLVDNPGLYSTRTLVQGETLGALESGTFNAACGYAYQPANWFHLHWAFPNADLQVESWTLSVSTGVWTDGAKTARAGRDWISARPTPPAEPTPTISPTPTSTPSNTPTNTPTNMPTAISPHVGSDFDGDGDTDVSIYRPLAGTWYVKDEFFVNYGLTGDLPIPGDYNGDGTTDVAVYRPSTGTWYIKDQFYANYGLPGDVPVPGDYNGDDVTDIAIFRPDGGTWYMRNQFYANFAVPGDIPVPGDYDGDGDTDIAVYRPDAGTWYIRDQFYVNYGLPGDIPIPADYDGDGITDIAVYRPSAGTWYIRNQGFTNYGLPGDVPVPADYNADGKADIAIYRPSSGSWAAQGMFSANYGLVGDYPLPAPDTNADGIPYQ